MKFHEYNDNNKENITDKHKKKYDNTLFMAAKAGMHVNNDKGNYYRG